MNPTPVIRIHAIVPTWTFPERLRKVRRQMKLTQAAFSDLLGVKESAYSGWETGRNAAPDILRFSELLEEKTGVSRYWFRGDLDGPTTTGPEADNFPNERFGNLQPTSIAPLIPLRRAA